MNAVNTESGPGQEAVEHLADNMQLIACAGAGKTEAVSRRVVAQLSQNGVDSENVVAFTYNERAAAELKDRIARRYEEANGTRKGLADLYVGTIHGFCLDLLQQHEFEALSYRVLNDVQQKQLISRNSSKSGLNRLNWGRGARYWGAGTYAEVMSILREADVDHSKLAGSDAEACLEDYLNLLHDKRYLDFTAIISEVVLALEDSDSQLRERIADRVRFLTVDEYQDVNPLQERLIEALAGMGATVTVVGDDDQLLYSWRGSRVANILGFAKRYPKVREVRLERNFRSSPGVVDLSRSVIEHNDPDRLDKTMVSADRQTYEKGDVDLLESDLPDDEAAHIAARIKELVGTPFKDTPESANRGLSYSDMAVLVRVRKLIDPIVGALDAEGIDYVVGGMANLFDTIEAQAARELFNFLAGSSSAKELEQVWKKAKLGATAADLKKAIAIAKSNRSDIEKGEGRFGIYNLQRSFLDFLDAFELRESKIASAHGAKDGLRRAEVVYYNLGKFSEIISDFEQIHFQSDPQRKYDTFADFLHYQAADIYPEGWLEARYVTPDAVQVMTIHQAKGLQWPAVFVPGLTVGRFPPQRAGGIRALNNIPDGAIRNRDDYEDSQEDERRLFYVACTRAKKYLSISRAEYPTSETRSWHNPSPFWAEANEAFAALAEAAPKPRRMKLTPEPARSISDVTLSFSELKYAFECPYSFKLRFIYGFNPPIDEALGYGKGLHDALFELHDRALHGGDTTVGAVDGLVDRHLFLPFSYRDLNQKLNASARKRLSEYIEKRGATFDDIEHAERPIELDLGDGIRVTGRIDLIRRRSTKEVVVIDFKSTDRAQQEEVTDLQLHVYALGYEQATGERPSSVVVENLDKLPDDASDGATPVTSKLLNGAAAVAIETGTRLRDNDLPRRPRGTSTAEHDKTCERCDLSGICGTHTAD